jgi:hypothetical protein
LNGSIRLHQNCAKKGSFALSYHLTPQRVNGRKKNGNTDWREQGGADRSEKTEKIKKVEVALAG